MNRPGLTVLLTIGIIACGGGDAARAQARAPQQPPPTTAPAASPRQQQIPPPSPDAARAATGPAVASDPAIEPLVMVLRDQGKTLAAPYKSMSPDAAAERLLALGSDGQRALFSALVGRAGRPGEAAVYRALATRLRDNPIEPAATGAAVAAAPRIAQTLEIDDLNEPVKIVVVRIAQLERGLEAMLEKLVGRAPAVARVLFAGRPEFSERVLRWVEPRVPKEPGQANWERVLALLPGMGPDAEDLLLGMALGTHPTVLGTLTDPTPDARRDPRDPLEIQWMTRCYAVTLFGEGGSYPALKRLGPLVESPNAKLRQRVEQLMGARPPKSLAPIVQQFASAGTPAERRTWLDRLEKRWPLLKVIFDPAIETDVEAAAAAVQVLDAWCTAKHGEVDTLVPLLEHRDPRAAMMAAKLIVAEWKGAADPTSADLARITSTPHAAVNAYARQTVLSEPSLAQRLEPAQLESLAFDSDAGTADRAFRTLLERSDPSLRQRPELVLGRMTSDPDLVAQYLARHRVYWNDLIGPETATWLAAQPRVDFPTVFEVIPDDRPPPTPWSLGPQSPPQTTTVALRARASWLWRISVVGLVLPAAVLLVLAVIAHSRASNHVRYDAW